MKKDRKIIFDTNIWITYFIRKKSTELINFAYDNHLVLYADLHLRNELIDVINRNKLKKYLNKQDIEDALFIFDNLTTYVITEKSFSKSPDIKDNFLFDLALQTSSQIIVTGDKKLLAFKTKGVELISLTTFKNRLKEN